MVSAQAVKWLHRFYGVKAPNLSLRGGQRPTWRPEREARGSALGVQSREGSCVFAGLSCYPTGYCEIATAPLGPRNDNSGVHTILLLAMTRQEGARCTSALLRLNHPRTRRSGSAATGWLWVPAILMAARSKRRCGPAKNESFIFSRFLLLSRQPEVKAIRRKPDIDANHVLFTFYMIA